jgi:predicted glycosyltransferase
MARADLVVAMAGYNTTVELLNAGTPTLLIPRSGPSAEQRTRARLFADRDWVRWLDPDHLEPDVVAGAIVNALRNPLAPSVGPDLGGRATAVSHLTRHLGVIPDADLESVAT